MKEVLLVYLAVGLLFGLILEIAWPYFADEEDGELQGAHRLLVVFVWPIVLFIAFINILLGEEDDNGEGPREGWGY